MQVGQISRREVYRVGLVRSLCLALLALLLAACNKVPVAQSLTQNQATEIVAVLNSQGIGAEANREIGGRDRYDVQVKHGDYSEAVAVLHAKGLPSEARPSFNELIAQRGIIPNSREIEFLRLDRALAAEIEETLHNNPGIVNARVVVRVHALQNTGSESVEPGVSVVVLTRTGAVIDRSEIAAVVTRAVPGVSEDKVFVSIHAVPPDEGVLSTEGVMNAGSGRVLRVPLTPFLWVWRVPESEYNSLALTLFGVILMVLVLGGVVGFWYAYYRRAHDVFESEILDLGPQIPKSGSLKAPEKTHKHLPGI